MISRSRAIFSELGYGVWLWVFVGLVQPSFCLGVVIHACSRDLRYPGVSRTLWVHCFFLTSGIAHVSVPRFRLWFGREHVGYWAPGCPARTLRIVYMRSGVSVVCTWFRNLSGVFGYLVSHLYFVIGYIICVVIRVLRLRAIGPALRSSPTALWPVPFRIAYVARWASIRRSSGLPRPCLQLQSHHRSSPRGFYSCCTGIRGPVRAAHGP